MHLILLIDDEEKLRGLLGRIIRLEGFDVIEAASLKAGMLMLEKHPIELVLCDVRLPDGSGVDFTEKIKQRFPAVEVILLTAYGNIPDGVQAIKYGAFDYLVKGDDNAKLIPVLHRALEKIQLAQRVKQLEDRLGQRVGFSQIIGTSPAILQSVTLAQRVAETDTSVLLLGETGSGKEVFAQAIHEHSARKAKPFVALNCAAVSRELWESTLFGHRAGAFTGALKDHKGLFEEAHRGTLFLDEIGEMPIDLQAKLLRVLETGAFMRVGDSRTIQVNVRLIAATNRDLLASAKQGQFREDLFYRISVFQITLPPLRERKADILLLAQHFLTLFAAKQQKRIEGMHPAYERALLQHTWPGNIRELRNMIERSVILADSAVLSDEHLPTNLTGANASSTALGSSASIENWELAAIEKQHIERALRHTGGNKTKAAELLHIGISTLYRKLSEYHID